MARTFVQQSQIRDTEVKSDSSTLGSGLENTTDLAADLNALRSLIKDIKGEGSWYEAAGQDLAEIAGAMTVGAAGADGERSATFSDSVSVANGVTVDAGGLTVTAGGAEITAGGLDIVDGGLDVQAGGATIAGDNLLLEAADLTIRDSAASAAGSAITFSVDAGTGDTVIEGTLSVAGESTLESVTVSDLTDGRIVLAGVDGSLEDQGGLTYSVGSGAAAGVVSLALNGALDMEGNLDVGASFEVTAADGSMSAAGGKFDVDADGAMDAANGAFIVGSDGNLAIATDKFTVSALGVVYADSSLSAAGDLAIGPAAGPTFTVESTDGSMSAAGGDFTVSAAGAVYAASDLEVGAKFDVTAADGSMSAANGALIVGADGSITISDGEEMMFEAAADGDVTMAGNLQINGNLIKSSTGATAMTLDGTNVTVAGNLTVNGQTTTIDTDNLSVKDTLIHLNAGGTSAKARGIVMHGSAADGFSDLGFGAAASDGDFVFAREIDDSLSGGDVDGLNNDVFASATLAAAWMSSLKLGGEQGTLKGALSYDSGDLLVKLESESDLRLVGAGDLKLQAHNEEWNLSAASAGVDSLTDWNDQFDGASIIEAILSLASGGSYAQKVLAAAVAEVPAGDEISFSSVGSLRDFATMSDADKEKSIDVYLNGVRLVQGASEDYELFSASSLKMKSGINVLPEDRIFIRINNPA